MMPKLLSQLYKTGVYCWLNKVNGKRYVGSAARSLKHRRAQWVCDLNSDRGVKKNPHLQSAWRKYGADAFEFIVLEHCHPGMCVKREQHYIDLYNSANPEK